MHEYECVGGGVGGDPEEEVVRDLGHGELEGDRGEEDAVKDFLIAQHLFQKYLSKMERLFSRLAKLGFSSTSFLSSAQTQMMLPNE